MSHVNVNQLSGNTGGELYHVPLHLISSEGITPEARRALVEGYRILRWNPGLYNGDLDKLRNMIGLVLSGESDGGLLFEDQDAAGSISVEPEQTAVERRRVGEWEVATEELFNMVHKWAEADRATSKE